MTKGECRQLSNALLKNVSPEQLQSRSEKLTPHLDELMRGVPLDGNPRVVAIYRAFGKELSLTPWLNTWGRKGDLRLLFPRRLPDSETWAWSEISREDFLSDAWVKQPDGTFAPKDISAVAVESALSATVVFVPGKGFSLNGSRVGRGKGHYDQLLRAPLMRSAKKIGVCHQETLFAALDQDPWDVSMDAIVTPDQLVWSTSERNS